METRTFYIKNKKILVCVNNPNPEFMKKLDDQLKILGKLD